MTEFKDVFSNTENIEINGKTYKVGKVTIGDIVSFQNWCDKEQKKELIELYRMSGEKVNIKELKELSFDANGYNQKMNSTEGVLFLFCSIIQRLNKDVDIEELKNNLTIADLNKIAEIINESLDEGEQPSENFQQEKKQD